MDQFCFPSPLFHSSPKAMGLSKSTAYTTEFEGMNDLIPIDESLKGLLDRISIMPDATGLPGVMKEDDSFTFTFPPLKKVVGI